MSTAVSPLAPKSIPALPPIAGVRMATAEAGIRYAGRTDVLLAVFEPGTAVAGVFTRSRCPSAPVEWCRERLAGGSIRALVVNSGNANAFTGATGRQATKLTAELAARSLGCSESEIFLASTGVIGEPLDASKFGPVMDRLAADGEEGAWEAAARAIMTTDTFPKLATRTARIGDATVTINGIAKGAGMIAPDMATMLSFIATDAAIAPTALQAVLSDAVERSFNCVTIDGDTSTSDTLLAFATGKAVNEIENASDPALDGFKAAFEDLLIELAQLVARDGEGARKFVTVEVEGAESDLSARKIALSIANSPLVKTAIAGEDANWGRVVMAVGKAGEPADRDLLTIRFGDVRVAHLGARDPDYDEAVASAYMKNEEITVAVELGLGTGKARVWTCDLTEGYIAINADYRS
ncbi:bifunctional glutamate N-acetyltransferase/amino-acid acetyltransferase ArgJ [Hansschlegelia quercus]|uniref:Arginine biosynthesis bifunctional protein ArgJ n=1 Tax=Hansschlegelia quercus TaxID=2528245 RepID=A0A4Q9GID9_9HYPH|nr:bifunctional glutamate N-acetyltransferase/amino-acid acetyltransferase ArgJ [Hansschlegelia quercus]TBN53973.1 bifunctional glutamate N-acetyltransferase/amino-acid acetyltransferase ArgJ [Hansschlegelia quercus]